MIILEQFLLIFILIYCVFMIILYFKNKSKKYKKTLLSGTTFLIKMYDIPINDIYSIEKKIILVDAFITAIDLTIYINISSYVIKFIIMFIVTFILILILYGLLGRYYNRRH